MGVKLGVLRYKRFKVFENRVLGRIFVNLRERRGGRRLEKLHKRGIKKRKFNFPLVYVIEKKVKS